MVILFHKNLSVKACPLALGKRVEVRSSDSQGGVIIGGGDSCKSENLSDVPWAYARSEICSA